MVGRRAVVSRPVCVLPSPGLASSRITHFFIFQQQPWCVFDQWMQEELNQICLVPHEEAKAILTGGAGVGAVSFGEERGAQNIWWWPAALSARAGPSGTSESVVFCVGSADANASRICRQLCSLASCSTARIERSVEARRHAVLRYHGYHLPPY